MAEKTKVRIISGALIGKTIQKEKDTESERERARERENVGNEMKMWHIDFLRRTQRLRVQSKSLSFRCYALESFPHSVLKRN